MTPSEIIRNLHIAPEEIVQVVSLPEISNKKQLLLINRITILGNAISINGVIAFSDSKSLEAIKISNDDSLYDPYEVKPIIASSSLFVDKSGNIVDQYIKTDEEYMANPAVSKTEYDWFVENMTNGGLFKESFILQLWNNERISKLISTLPNGSK